MSDPAEKEGMDTTQIDEKAPSTLVEPLQVWCAAQSLQGKSSTYLTEKEVPGADLTGKWIVISGSNNGIGREAALSFAAWGANLILACRNPPAVETHPTVVVDECKARAKAAGHVSTVEWWELDMGDFDSVSAFAQRWLDTGRPLDILCNNAGVAGSYGGEKVVLTKNGFELVHQINFLSHVLLTLRLLPSVAKSVMPRIVCTTSCLHFRGKFDLDNLNGGDILFANGGSPYGNNKLYYQCWLAELQQRMLEHEQYKHITINGVHPGYVNSGIWTTKGPRGWLPLREIVMKTLATFFAISSQQGSLAISYVATSPECGPDPTVQGVGPPEGKGGGRYFNRIWELEPMPHCKHRPTRVRLWKKVNEELKLREKGLLDILGD